MYIIKRNGRKQKFNILKVQKAYTKALKETSTEFTEELIKNINSYVENNLKENISVEEIQDLVEIALAKSDLMEAAKHFIIYRDKHNTYRSYIKDILDHFENKDLFYEVLRNGQKKYKELAPSYNKLLVKFKSFLKPKYTEQEAINALIKASLECTTAEEPNWEYISGNIYTCYNNYLIKQFDEQFETWHDKLIYLCDNNYYHEFIKNEYDKEEIMFFYEYMNKVHKERSYLLNYSGSELLFKRYVIRSRDNKPLETPIEMFMGISMFLNRKENKNTRTQLVVNLFDILSTLKVTMATPTMNNARKPYHQLSSCFIDTMPDSLTGIYRSTTNFAQISKLGGGMGMYVGKIRASGSDIRGFKGVAAGVIPWVKLLNSTAVAVDQLGNRSGSCAAYIDIWHKDVLQMLQIRTNNGDDRMKAHDIFPAICYPDYFWKQVDTNMNNIWYLMCPKEIYDVMGYRLEDCFGEEWETKYKECIANPDINKHEIVIKDLVRLILKSVIETGTPFAFNRDIANKFNPNNHVGNIYSSNLCVSGDTKILTDKGYIPMKENEGRSVNVWNGKQWSETIIVKTGENQELLEIEFSNGSIIKCTPYHKFYVLKQYPLGNNNFRNTEEETRAIDLKINDELFRYKLPDTENFQRGIKVVSINKVEGLHDTFCVNEPLRHKVIFNGVITGNCVEIIQNMAPIQDGESYLKDGIVTETSIPGEMVVCNLASLVLSRINWKSDEEVEFIISTIIRTLDNVIDNNYYPVPYAESTNQKYRALGLGMQGYHHLLVKNGIKWESDKHLEFADKIFEKINYYAIKASNNLAKEKGVYTYFEGSDWHTGTYFDKRNYISEKWIQLKEDVSKFGMRNAYLLALAPTGSTSYVAGTSACADPIMNKFFLEEKRSSTVPRVAPELNDKTWWLYKSAYDIDQVWSMRAAGVRQRHIDQSQSTNLYITNEYSLKQVLNLYLEAWKNGIKTIYYVRSKSLEVEECESCAS